MTDDRTGAGGGPDEPSGAGSGSSTPQGFLTTAGFWLVLMITILIFAFVFFYFWQLGGDNFTSSESIRPLLVLTLIAAMLGFGGLLIIRALFAPYPDDVLQERFRLGREIFLVFSGIFGTIIGFYFGAEDDDRQGGAPTVTIAFADGRVNAAVADGSEPFIGIFTPRDAAGGELMTADERVLSFTPEGGTCPEGGTVTVIDGRGRRAQAVVECGEETAAGNDIDEQTAVNGTENAALANNTGG